MATVHCVPFFRSFTLSLFHFFVLFWLLGCGADAREQARIPAMPRNADSLRQSTTLRMLDRAASQSATALARRAAVRAELGRYQQALDDINEAIDRNDNVGAFHLLRAELLFAQQNVAPALEAARRAEILGVNSARLYTLLGALLQQQGQLQPARLALARAGQMAPYSPDVYQYAGLLAARERDTTRALALLERSVSQNVRYLPAHQQLVKLSRSAGDVASALNYGERALRLFPKDAQLLLEQGRVYQQAGRADSALAYFRKTLRVHPQSAAAYAYSGEIFLRQRRAFDAMLAYERVKRLDPAWPGLTMALAKSYEQSGRLSEAAKAYEEAVQTDPNDWQARAGLARTSRRSAFPGGYGDDYFLTPTEPSRPQVTRRDTAGAAFRRMRTPMPVLQPRRQLSGGQNDSTLRSKLPKN